MTRLKRITGIALFPLGLFEVFVGFVLGPIHIYGAEPALARKIGVSSLSPENQRIYHDYMARFQSDWAIVAGFGVLTIAASVILSRRERIAEHKTVQ
jgi:hypothetical protein